MLSHVGWDELTTDSLFFWSIFVYGLHVALLVNRSLDCLLCHLRVCLVVGGAASLVFVLDVLQIVGIEDLLLNMEYHLPMCTRKQVYDDYDYDDGRK